MRKNNILAMHLHLFTRDLRVFDNRALIKCCKFAKNEPVVLGFIFTPTQTSGAYFNHYSLRFLIDSLGELNVHIFYGEILDVIKKLNLKSLFIAKDVTPFAKRRSEILAEYCKNQNIHFEDVADYTLHPFDAPKTKTGGVYHVFTPFFRACQELPVENPLDFDYSAVDFVKSPLAGEIGFEEIDKLCNPRGKDCLVGGRSHALKILSRIREHEFKKYDSERNTMHPGKTTLLAAYLKFGCISIREAYHAILKGNGKTDSLMSELYWREFYQYLTWHKDFLLQKQISPNENLGIKSKMNRLKWKEPKGKEWEAFIAGKTGFPIVDAGIRQMLETGFMHNRARMIVAMFLTKDLFIDWRAGEQFFAQNLIDYDPASNSGGWQWSSSVGVDTQPYRIFNPWTQTERYDGECKYILKWVPELRSVPVVDILRWDKPQVRAKHKTYISPIVDHSVNTKLAKQFLMGQLGWDKE